VAELPIYPEYNAKVRRRVYDGGMPMRRAFLHFLLSFGDYMRYIEHVSSCVRE